MAAPANDEARVNDRIRAREVRLIGPDGAQLGIKSVPDAISIARNMELDLVEVAPDARPPVCRIMDYRKYRYEAQQRAKESRRKSTNIVVKEMKYRPKIGDGDFWTKTRKVMEFLAEGHKVKVTIMFRGREMQHPELGMRILDRIAVEVRNLAKVEASARQDGKNMTMVLGPDKKAQAAHAAELKKLAEEKLAEESAASTPSDSPEPTTDVEVSVDPVLDDAVAVESDPTGSVSTDVADDAEATTS